MDPRLGRTREEGPREGAKPRRRGEGCYRVRQSTRNLRVFAASRETFGLARARQKLDGNRQCCRSVYLAGFFRIIGSESFGYIHRDCTSLGGSTAPELVGNSNGVGQEQNSRTPVLLFQAEDVLAVAGARFSVTDTRCLLPDNTSLRGDIRKPENYMLKIPIVNRRDS